MKQSNICKSSQSYNEKLTNLKFPVWSSWFEVLCAIKLQAPKWFCCSCTNCKLFFWHDESEDQTYGVIAKYTLTYTTTLQMWHQCKTGLPDCKIWICKTTTGEVQHSWWRGLPEFKELIFNIKILSHMKHISFSM